VVYPRKLLGYQTPYDCFARDFHKEHQMQQTNELISA